MRLYEFYRLAWVNAADKTIYFVHQNGVYPILLLLQGRLDIGRFTMVVSFSSRLENSVQHSIRDDRGLYCNEPIASTQDVPCSRCKHGINMAKFSKNAVYNKNHDILVLGRITPVKRIDLIIDAVASGRLLDIHPRVHLW